MPQAVTPVASGFFRGQNLEKQYQIVVDAKRWVEASDRIRTHTDGINSKNKASALFCEEHLQKGR